MTKQEAIITTIEQFGATLKDLKATRQRLGQILSPSLDRRETIFQAEISEFWRLPKPQQIAIRLKEYPKALRRSNKLIARNFASVIERILNDPIACEVLPFAVGENAADDVANDVNVMRYFVNKDGARCEIAMGMDGSSAVLYTPSPYSLTRIRIDKILKQVKKPDNLVVAREKHIGFMVLPYPITTPVIQVYNIDKHRSAFLQVEVPTLLSSLFLSEINTILSEGVICAPSFDGVPYHQMLRKDIQEAP
jgi:hypothetical protein